jgi:hypothetical protein
MSTYLLPIYGYKINIEGNYQNLADLIYENTDGLLNIGDPNAKQWGQINDCDDNIGLYCSIAGNSDTPDIVFGFHIRELALEPIFNATDLNILLDLDIRKNPQFADLATQLSIEFREFQKSKFVPWLKIQNQPYCTYCETTNIWQGPTTWLCPIT